MSLRLWVDEDTPDHQCRTEHETWREYFRNPTDIGGVFIRATLVFILLIKFSIIGAVIEIGVLGIENPVSVWAFFFFLATTSALVFGYTLWSFIMQLQLRNQLSSEDSTHLLIRPIQAIRLAFADGDELNEYEARVQKTVLGLITSIIIGYIPIRILADILIASFSL